MTNGSASRTIFGFIGLLVIACVLIYNGMDGKWAIGLVFGGGFLVSWYNRHTRDQQTKLDAIRAERREAAIDHIVDHVLAHQARKQAQQIDLWKP